ncbi:MAG: helix-turn-helix domain-containing protein, partial [Saprospiraceae bacterium]
ELRKEQKLSFSELAQRTGMSISYLNEIEKGKKYPKQDKIEALARGLDCTVDKFATEELHPALKPVGNLLKSNFLNELPLDLFGLNLQQIVEMISNAPKRVGAFISTLVELSKNYALQEDNFYFGAMRAYQELHYNFFEGIEEKTETFVKENKLEQGKTSSNLLAGILAEKFNCEVIDEGLAEFPELKNTLAVLKPKKNQLLIQKGVNEKQRSFIIARELGFRYLELKDRPYYTPLRTSNSFEPVLSNFKATYFATAMMMNREEVAERVRAFCSRSTWDGDAFVKIIDSYNVTPEMFVHRLTQILPQYFQLKQLYFIRVRTLPELEKFTIDKVLHLNQSHHPHSNKIYEHYCRRWGSVDTLKELKRQRRRGEEAKMIAHVQRSRYHETEDEYLTISIAIPSSELQGKDISVTFGILMDDFLRKVVGFSADENILDRIVNKTCERCPIEDCRERAVKPTVFQRRKSWEATKKKLDELMKE